MAADLTIDHYLDALRRSLRGHHGRDDILLEVEDHLRTTAERMATSGLGVADAEAEAVLRFGDHEVVADALLAANGAPAVPTTYTVGIGTTATAGSVAWLALAAAFWGSYLAESGGSDWDGTPRLLFMLGVATLAAGGVVATLLQAALRNRLGDGGRLTLVGLGITVLATTASLVAWAIPLWGALFAMGCLPVAVVAARHGAAPRAWAILFGAAWPLGLGTMALLRAVEFGEVDEWGDYPAASLTGMTVGCIAMTTALIGLGRWLRHETPVDLPSGRALA